MNNINNRVFRFTNTSVDRFIPNRRAMEDQHSTEVFQLERKPVNDFEETLYNHLFNSPSHNSLLRFSASNRKQPDVNSTRKVKDIWQVVSKPFKELDGCFYSPNNISPIDWGKNGIAVTLSHECYIVPVTTVKNESCDIHPDQTTMVLACEEGQFLTSVKWDPAGTKLALSFQDKSVKILDVTTQSYFSGAVEDSVKALSFDREEEVTCMGQSIIQSIDLRIPSQATFFHQTTNRLKAFLKRDFSIIAGTEEGILYEFDVRRSDSYMKSITLPQTAITDIKPSPNKDSDIAVATNLGVSLYNLATHQFRQIKAIKTDLPVNSLLWLKSRAIITAHPEGTTSFPIKVWDVASHSMKGEMQIIAFPEKSVHFLAASPNKEIFISIGESQRISFFESPTYAVPQPLRQNPSKYTVIR